MSERAPSPGEGDDRGGAGLRDLTELRHLLGVLEAASDRWAHGREPDGASDGALSTQVWGPSGEAAENRAIHRTRSPLAREDAAAVSAEVDDLRGRVSEALARARLAVDGARGRRDDVARSRPDGSPTAAGSRPPSPVRPRGSRRRRTRRSDRVRKWRRAAGSATAWPPPRSVSRRRHRRLHRATCAAVRLPLLPRHHADGLPPAGPAARSAPGPGARRPHGGRQHRPDRLTLGLQPSRRFSVEYRRTFGHSPSATLRA